MVCDSILEIFIVFTNITLLNIKNECYSPTSDTSRTRRVVQLGKKRAAFKLDAEEKISSWIATPISKSL